MRMWFVVFEDAPQDVVTISDEGDKAAMLKRFDAAAKAEAIDRRKVRGMWIIDNATQYGDVLKVYGIASANILKRHGEWKDRSERIPS